MIPKFRAWLKKEQKMDNEIDHISWLEDELYCIGDGITYMVSAEDLVLMQSTGLKDKNGKEVFEGDVVSRNSGMPSVVEFGKWIYEEDFGYKIKNIGFYLNSSYDDDEFFQAMDYEDIRKNYEVIGNIYENPELLEDK
jgi:hypothetical protein